MTLPCPDASFLDPTLLFLGSYPLIPSISNIMGAEGIDAKSRDCLLAGPVDLAIFYFATN
jgi:hypothetical protein